MIDDLVDIPDYESPEETLRRLDLIHKELLEKKGLTVKPQKNSPGFAPTVEQARQVAVMACLGLEAQDIALILNIEVKLLKLYYTKELRVTHNLANALVARQALMMALSGRFPDMTKFWLKTRAKWKETSGIELTGANGGPIETVSAKDRLKQAIGMQTDGDSSVQDGPG